MRAKSPALLLTLTLAMLGVQAHAGSDESGITESPLGRLESYEPNILGYAHDSNDVDYMDFKVSLKYPLFHNSIPKPPLAGIFPHAYLAFTGRFSQYIGTRESSPVISKRFNPELIGRYWLDTGMDDVQGYIDIAYGHESNGQSIGTLSEYTEKRQSFMNTGENPDYANDHISRGWDYIGTTTKFTYKNPFATSSYLTGYLGMRYFLENGLLQGNQEEYNDWENNVEGKRRKSVDGLNLKLKYETKFLNNDLIKSNKVFLGMTTGYADIFEYNSYRAEWSVEVKNVPILIWAAKGYNSDLADYYKDVTSFGIGLEFVSK